jgi:hypothetical protein
MGGQKRAAKNGRPNLGGQKWAAKDDRCRLSLPLPFFWDFTATRTRLAPGLGTRWEDPTRILTPTYHWPVRNYNI